MNKWIAEFELEDGDTMPEHMDLEYKGVRIDFHCKPLEQEPNCSEIPTGSTTKNCRFCRNFGTHHGICEICKDNRCWIEKEPTTRNCFGCKYSKDNHNAGTEECHLCMWENQYTPITKNNLTDYLSRAEMVKYQEYLDGKISNDCVRFR